MQNFMSHSKNMSKYKNRSHKLNTFDEALLSCFKPKKSLNETLRIMAYGLTKFFTSDKKTLLKDW